MKISYSYLKKFLNTKLTKKKLTEVFTQVGFECEIDGNIIEFDVTPNRGDVLSLRGLQREFCVSQSKNFQNKFGFGWGALPPRPPPKRSFVTFDRGGQRGPPRSNVFFFRRR